MYTRWQRWVYISQKCKVHGSYFSRRWNKKRVTRNLQASGSVALQEVMAYGGHPNLN